MERIEFTELSFMHSKQKYIKTGKVSIPTADLGKAIIKTADDHFSIWWIGAPKQTIIVKENPIKLLEQED
jgi:hypothetical protein